MRGLLRPVRDKSGLSNIVAYVLLIAITVSLSVIVYGWLRFYVTPDDIPECSDSVNIIVRSYKCYLPGGDGVGGRLNVVLKNKGLFSVDGYVLRVHDSPDARFGFYLFEENSFDELSDGKLKPGEEYSKTYRFVDYPQGVEPLEEVTLLEVQPFMVDEDGEIKCKSYATQEVECVA